MTRAHKWKIINATVEDTTYKCVWCKERFSYNELVREGPKQPPRLGCTPPAIYNKTDNPA